MRVNGRRRPSTCRTGTIDLSGMRGSLDVVAALSRWRPGPSTLQP